MRAGPGINTPTRGILPARPAAFDERLVLWRDFGEHYARFDIVSKPSCVEAVLQ